MEEAVKEDARGGRHAHNKRKAKKDVDAKIVMPVSLETLYKGGEVGFKVNRRIVCRRCSGVASRKPRCKGCGSCPPEIKMVTRRMGNMLMRQQQKVASQEKCKTVDTHLTAVVEKGMADGTEIKFERMNQETPGKIPGDVILVVKQNPHKEIRREGNDLHAKIRISLKESLLGFSKQLSHLDGHITLVESTGVTKPFEVKKIKNQGMPFHNVPSQQGKLHVTVEVVYPTELTAKQKKVIGKHFE